MEVHKTYIEAREAAIDFFNTKYKYKYPVQIESDKDGIVVFYSTNNPKSDEKYICKIEK